MADDSYDVEFNAKENVSDIVRKMARAVESFSEDMGELVYQLEDAVEAQEKFAASVQKAESSTKKQDAQIKKSVRRIGELKKALKEYGISGAESLKVSDVFKGSAADITEFKKRLEQTGDTLSNFIERGAIDFDLGDELMMSTNYEKLLRNRK